MTIYTIADAMTGLIEAIVFFILLDTFSMRKTTIPSWIYGIGVIFLTALINISNMIFSSGIMNAVGMSLSCFAVSFLYNGKIPFKAVASVLTIAFIGIIEIIVLFSITAIYDITVSEAVDIPSYRLLGIIISKTLTLVLANILRVSFKKRNFHIGTSYWILFVLIFSTSIVTVFLIFKLSYDIESTYMYNLSILCSFGLLFSTFFALYLYERLAKQSETIRNQKRYEEHLKMQVKHLDEMVAAQNQLRKFKHDFSNHVIGINSYLDEKDFDGAKKYVNSLSGFIDSDKNTIITGNTPLDAIINTKKTIAESKNIEFATKIQIPPELPIDPVDISVIFGNALDNAIEACDRVNSAERIISLTLTKQNENIFCKIVNSSPEPKKSAFKTSKADKENHGFGLENIKGTLAKYNSEPNISYSNNEFTLKFIIFTED